MLYVLCDLGTSLPLVEPSKGSKHHKDLCRPPVVQIEHNTSHTCTACHSVNTSIITEHTNLSNDYFMWSLTELISPR